MSIGGSTLISMLVDSGSDLDIISRKDWGKVKAEASVSGAFIYNFKDKPESNATSYEGKPLEFSGTFETVLSCRIKGKPSVAAKFWVSEHGRSLISYKTAVAMRLIKVGVEVNSISLDRKPFPSIPGVRVSFELVEGATPTCQSYYNVPAALEQAAIRRLRDMEAQGIIEKYDGPSTWLSGMSAVPKGKHGDFRLVVNMKAPNKAIKRQYYTLPTIDSLRVKLSGARFFSKLDLTSAFYHLKLDKKSRELTTFMGPDGPYRFKRLVFGVNCAPEIFQKEMERILSSIPGTIVYIDDILIFASTLEELRATTLRVKDALSANNLTLNSDKCEYEKETLTFLGQEVSEAGMDIGKAKVADVRNFREPKTMSELSSFLGLASYVANYVPNLSSATATLRKAAKKETFEWTELEGKSFAQVKELIINETSTNGYYALHDKTTIYTDAGPDALGAVLTQTNAANKSRIIAFASRSLSDIECAYPQIQKEALGVVWGVERFHYYLLGRPFIIKTDAAGLTWVFTKQSSETKRTSLRASGFALRLSHFDFTIEHVKGTQNIADPSSRLCKQEATTGEYITEDWPNTVMQITESEGTVPSLVFTDQSESIDQTNTFSPHFIAPNELRWHENSDKSHQLLMKAVTSNEWPDEIVFYKRKQESLRILNGSVLADYAIVLPTALRAKALRLAHKGHPGESGMLHILRARVWWPGMATSAKNWVKSCVGCTLTSKMGPPAEMLRTELPIAAMEKISIDFNGPYSHLGGIHILVMVCNFSRYLWLFPVRSTAFSCMERVFTEVFRTFGLPGELRSDNGPPFSGKEYKKYADDRGIKLSFATPYYPQQNGLAERYMQLVNKTMKITKLEGTNFHEALREVEKAHNSTKHATTGLIPEEVMFTRKLRGSLPLLEPMIVRTNDEEMRARDKALKHRSKEIEDRKRGAKEPDITIGDSVVILKQQPQKGDPKFSPTRYEVVNTTPSGDLQLVSENGVTTKRNVRHAKKVIERSTTYKETVDGDQKPQDADSTSSTTSAPMNRPAREKRPPGHLKDFIVSIVETIVSCTDPMW